ncbi:hypothetical protein [Chamaesiphon sp. OTE_8_metabat_110]|uniref:hypothetical protein n=1 Tax=Chamaesiphon sp. OTE_8_metabat_110 TaxID=2964696 RepID=UPI00286C1F7A|nr:hypothetical protein [Chamaesiphon sp. OTE_8_metabat_110]
MPQPFNRSILRILPLIFLFSPLAAFAKSGTPIVPMTMGQPYTGSLTPSPSNPNGEVCYGLSVEPDTRITLNVKTTGAGIVKFSLYDKTKGLQFFHNDVTSKSQAGGNTAIDSRFSFPALSEVSQLCLTTSNLNRGQQYNFTATAKPGRREKSRLVLRPVDVNRVTPISRSKHAPVVHSKVKIQPPTLPQPPLLTGVVAKVPIPPAPQGEPYCYVGTWQVADLSAYWLPTIKQFTQAKVTNPQMLGYAKIVINRDGNATFEAFDLDQKYTLKVKETGATIGRISVGLSGSASARFQVNSDSSLTFSSQNYQRLSPKLNLGDNLKLSGDRVFMLFGDRDLPPVKSQYKCLDRDNINLQILQPGGKKSTVVLLKRIN